MNAKEMPILKNSKDNYQHTSSKTSFSTCFNSARKIAEYVLLKQGYMNQSACSDCRLLQCQGNVAFNNCMRSQLGLDLSFSSAGRISSYSGGLGRTGSCSHDFCHIKRFECSRHTQCNSIDCIFPMLIYWLYLLLHLIARRAQYQLYNLSNFKFLAQERWPSLLQPHF